MGNGELFIIAAILIVLYLFLFLPQQKQSKKGQMFLEKLKAGDKVVTVGGIHGIIIDVNKDQVLLQMEYGNTQLLMEKKAIGSKVPSEIKIEATKKPTKQARVMSIGA